MIERVCVVGAGVIGSLYAAHLSRVADVWVLTRRREHARALAARRASPSPAGPTSPATVHATDDPAELPPLDVAIVATKATGLDAAARALEGRFPGATIVTVQNGLGAEQVVRRPRRLAARLRRHLHERHPPRRHARRVHPRHRDLARARTTGLPYERVEELAALIERSGLKARALPRPPAGAVVEADLQRDRERGRGADRPPARRALRRRGARRPTSATSSTRSSTRARRSRRRRGSSCTRTRGR